jgi:hypothetical protein
MIRWETEDALKCECGNEPWIHGFYTANLATREEVDLYLGEDWDGETWLCAGCGAVEIVAAWEEEEVAR